MKTIVWMLLAGLVLPMAGCSGNAALNGKWLGSVTEKGKSTQVSLVLRTQGDNVAGTFTILEGTGDTATGTSFTIVNARCSNSKLEFIVPISGRLDADAVFFELLVKNRRLEGIGRKMRQGSSNLPAVFVKQK